MKVLFVSSGNSRSGISPITKNQGDSILKFAQVEYYTIKGKGLKGYFKNIFKLRRYLRNNKFDIIHAHYSLSGIVATLAGARPLIVSLMGSDVKASLFVAFLIRIFSKFWKCVIVKSEDMKSTLRLNSAIVIPNGLDTSKFRIINKQEAQAKLGWLPDKRHILFAANPARKVKNFPLAETAFNRVCDHNSELHVLVNVSQDEMVFYYNAADIVLLSSLWEGSPNVVKEAMACNRPVVTTNVGDIEFLVGSQTRGVFVTDHSVEVYSKCLHEAIQFCRDGQISDGRERIKALGLDSESTAQKIVSLYQSTINEK
jgi:teichuronic acid biosynthesis glycosyltransferase TuaC